MSMAQSDKISIYHSMCYKSMGLTRCYKIAGDKLFHNKPSLFMTAYSFFNSAG